MNVNPETREIIGDGVNGSGIHMFQCASCSDGSVAYALNGARRDHVRKVAAEKPWDTAFEVSTYCPGNSGPVRGEVVTNYDWNTAYANATALAVQ